MLIILIIFSQGATLISLTEWTLSLMEFFKTGIQIWSFKFIIFFYLYRKQVDKYYKKKFCIKNRKSILSSLYSMHRIGRLYIKSKLKHLHAVSRSQQCRQKEPSVKTFCSPLSEEFWRHYVLSGRTQRRACPRHQSEEMEIYI